MINVKYEEEEKKVKRISLLLLAIIVLLTTAISPTYANDKPVNMFSMRDMFAFLVPVAYSCNL